MISLNTNLVLRFLLRDDEEQVKIFDESVEKNQKIFVDHNAISEAYWILEKIYNLNPKSIADRLIGFLMLPNVQIL